MGRVSLLDPFASSWLMGVVGVVCLRHNCCTRNFPNTHPEFSKHDADIFQTRCGDFPNTMRGFSKHDADIFQTHTRNFQNTMRTFSKHDADIFQTRRGHFPNTHPEFSKHDADTMRHVFTGPFRINSNLEHGLQGIQCAHGGWSCHGYD